MASNEAYDPFGEVATPIPKQKVVEDAYDPFSDVPTASVEVADVPLAPPMGDVPSQDLMEQPDTAPKEFSFEDYFMNKAKSVGDTIESGIEYLYGAGEAATTLATGSGAAIFGGIGGLGTLMQGYDSEQATNLVEKTMEDYTFIPKTEKGQQVLSTLSAPFEMWGQYTDEKADEAFYGFGEGEAGAVMGTAVKTAYEAVPAAFGLKPLTTAAKTATTGARTTANLTKLMRDDIARAEVQKKGAKGAVLRDIDDLKEGLAQVEKTDKIVNEIPLNLTLGEKTGSRGLLSRQKELETLDAKSIGQAFSRRKANIEAIDNFLTEKFGKSAPAVHKAFTEAKGKIDLAINKLDERITAVNKKREALYKRVGGSLEASGKNLRKLADENYQIAKAKGAALYGKVDNTIIDLAPVYSKVQELMEGKYAGKAANQIPDVLFDLNTRQLKALEDAKKTSLTASLTGQPIGKGMYRTQLKEVRELDSELGKAIAAEEGSLKPDRVVMRDLSIIKKELQKTMDSLELVDDPKVAEAYTKAKNYWRTEVADKYYSGLGKRIRQVRDKEWSIADEKLIDEMFSPAKMRTGGVKAAQEFKAIYGQAPEAIEQLNIGVLQKLKNKMPVRNGVKVIDQNALDNFKRAHASVLAEFPTIARQIDNIGAANEALAAMQTRLLVKQTRIKKGALAEALGTADYGQILDTAVKNPAVMKRLNTMVKGKEAREGLSLAVGDYLLNKHTVPHKDIEGVSYINADGVLKDLQRNGGSLSLAMEPKHLKALNEAYTALKILDRSELPTGVRPTVSVGKKIHETLGSSPRSILNMWRAMNQGRTSKVDVAAVLAGGLANSLNNKRVVALERAAHYDYNAARLLKELAEAEQMTPALNKRMLGVFDRLGLGAVTAAIEPEEETRADKERAIRKSTSTYNLMKGIR